MITNISQKDARWKNVRIGNSYTTIGRDGCTICACCMALEKLRHYFCNPKNAAYFWKFNNRGEILWKDTDFKGMKFVRRGYFNDMETIATASNHDDRAVIIEVNHRKHWLYVESVKNGRISVVDPIDGVKYNNLPKNYQITGYALFESQNYIPEWMIEAIDRAKEKGLKMTDPLNEVTLFGMMDVLKEMEIIKESEKQMTLGRWLVIIDKISEKY